MISVPTPASWRRPRPAALALGAGAVILTAGFLPAVLRPLPGSLVLVAPGVSFISAVPALRRTADRFGVAVLGVLLSLVALMAVCLALDVAGIAMTAVSVAEGVFVFQAACAAAMAFRTADTDLRTRQVREPLAIRPAILAVLATASVVALGVAVRAAAPSPPAQPYAWLTFANTDRPASVEAVRPGRWALAVDVRTQGTVGSGFVLVESLDGAVISSRTVGTLPSDATTELTVDGVVPQLDSCVHRVEVLLRAGPDRMWSVTRYVTGRGAGPCAARS